MTPGPATPPPPSLAVAGAVAEMRRRGERVTPARRAVLTVLDATREHLAAEEIVARAEACAPGVHRATIYRALATLGELGLVVHTHIAGAATVYHVARPAAEGAAADHGHVQCTSCAAVIDVPAALLTDLVQRLDSELHFRLEPEHVALLGRCARCR